MMLSADMIWKIDGIPVGSAFMLTVFLISAQRKTGCDDFTLRHSP